MPSNLKTYILGIYRAFSERWAYKLSLLEGPDFSCDREGLLSVLDN